VVSKGSLVAAWENLTPIGLVLSLVLTLSSAVFSLLSPSGTVELLTGDVCCDEGGEGGKGELITGKSSSPSKE